MVGYRHVGLPVAAEIQVIAAVANGERRHPGVGGPAGQDVGSAAAVEMLVMQVDDDAAVLPMRQVFEARQWICQPLHSLCPSVVANR